MATWLEIPAAARAALEEPRFAVLATVLPNGMPQQTVMWYLIDGDDLLFNTRRGRVKDRNLQRDARVSLCIEDGYRFIAIRGTVREIDDPAIAQADIARLAVRYHGPEKGQQMAADFRTQERITYRVKLDNILVNGYDTA